MSQLCWPRNRKVNEEVAWAAFLLAEVPALLLALPAPETPPLPALPAVPNPDPEAPVLPPASSTAASSSAMGGTAEDDPSAHAGQHMQRVRWRRKTSMHSD